MLLALQNRYLVADVEVAAGQGAPRPVLTAPMVLAHARSGMKTLCL